MELEIKGNTYRISKLSVFDQLKVSRKLLPVLAGMLSEFGSLKDAMPKLVASVKDNTEASNAVADLGPLFDKVIPKIASAVSALSDDDLNAVLFPCLTVTARKVDKNWYPVFRDGVLMYDDLNMIDMLQLVARVVGDSLGNILPALPAKETLTQAAG